MTKKKVVVSVVVIVVVIALMLFGANVSYNGKSPYSQAEFKNHFHIQENIDDGILEEYFTHNMNHNPTALIFAKEDTYSQRYQYHVNDNETYWVLLVACDNDNGYNLGKLGDTSHARIPFTYNLNMKGIDVYLELVKYDSDYGYDYRMEFDYLDCHYQLVLETRGKAVSQSDNGLDDHYKEVINDLINTLFE